MVVIKRVIKLFTAILLVFCMSFLPMSLPYNNVIKAETATIKLNKARLSLYVGKSYDLKLTGTNQKIKWTTSDSKVASVSVNGVVSGIRKGNATITACVGNSKYNCKVTVSYPVINKNKLNLEIADTTYLSIKGSTGSVKWKSSDKEVVTVNQNGFVYAKREGKAKITGTNKGKDYICSVTVTDKVLHASTTSLVCSRETILMITVDDLPINDYVHYNIEDSSIISCLWGEWNGDSIPLSIVLNNYGKTTITITADNTNEELTIDVTVIDDTRPIMNKFIAEDIYANCSPATAQVNTDLALGSGFFISSGKLVTNYHVIKGASEINVQLQNGEVYEVEYILGYSETLDIAILSIPVETEYLKINPYGLNVGEAVYAIGSPLGLTDTFTDGIISNESQFNNDGVEFIQINNAITHGNSGGPLINSYGEVIGIISMCIDDGQNLNFAIDIYQLYQVDISNPITVTDYYDSNAGKDNAWGQSGTYVYEDDKISRLFETCQYIPLNTYVYGTAMPVGIDHYRFTLDKESLIGFYGSSYYLDNTETSNLIFSIWNEDGDILMNSTPEYNDTENLFQCAITTLPPGTYYAGISTKKDSTTTPIKYLCKIFG